MVDQRDKGNDDPYSLTLLCGVLKTSDRLKSVSFECDLVVPIQANGQHAFVKSLITCVLPVLTFNYKIVKAKN